MKATTKARIGIAAGFTISGAVLFTPKSVPHWLWEVEGITLTIFLMAAAAVGAVMWERYGPKGCRTVGNEFTEAKAEFDAALANFRVALKGAGIQLLRRDEHEYDGPATLHYPEGGDR